MCIMCVGVSDCIGIGVCIMCVGVSDCIGICVCIMCVGVSDCIGIYGVHGCTFMRFLMQNLDFFVLAKLDFDDSLCQDESRLSAKKFYAGKISKSD